MKERMITRTINVTSVTFAVANMNTNAIETNSADIPGKLTADECLEYARKNLDTDYRKHVMVKDIQVNELLFGMPESTFMAYAKLLPPRKVYEENEN